MFRRPFRRPLQRALRPDVHPLLQRANDLLASGNYPAAAEAFEQLAHGARERGLPRDAQLFLQAGRCRILAGQVPLGMADLEQGLAIIAQRQNWPRLVSAGQQVSEQLEQHGRKEEAAHIRALIKASLPAAFAPAAENTSPARPMLPVACPACGGPLRADEVEWIDEASAECPFCGGVVRTGA